MAPGELEDLPEPAPAGLDELTEQPGPRNTWSWSPPPAGGRMGGCETTPPDSRTDPGKPAPPSGRLIHGKPQPGRLSSLAIIGRRSPASSSFVLASALTGATAAGAPARPRTARRPEHGSCEESQQQPSPAISRSPG